MCLFRVRVAGGADDLAVAASRRAIFGGVVRLSQLLGLGAVEMRAFDCMRRVRARVRLLRARTKTRGQQCTRSV